jgi:DNA repair photolyase
MALDIRAASCRSLSEEFRQKMEPYSAEYDKRLAALKALHDKGCKT